MQRLGAGGWSLGGKVWAPTVLLALACAATFLMCPEGVSAQADPLNAAYKPAVDCTPGDYPSNVSLTQAVVKLRQTADSPTSITGYGITPLPCVTIYGTQNAFADFQAHIQAPGGGYSGLTFTMSAMVKSTGPGGNYTIPAPATSGTGDNDIVVYREWYAVIPSAKQTGHIWFGTAANVPDVLIPAIDPYWHQTTAAFPVAVTASQNQSAWIDIYIPEAARSGWYSGTITISDSSVGTITTLPVLLAVWQWPAADGGFMPSTATLRTMQIADDFDGGLCNPNMGYTTSATCTSNYSGTGNKGPQYSLDDLIPQLLDNRMSLVSWSGYHSSINTIGTITALETEYANGTTTTRLNTILPGAEDRDIAYGKNGPSGSPSTWVGTFVTNGWFSTNQTFQYLADEPSGGTWATLNSNATTWRSATTPMMPMLVTTDVANATANSALNSIDWMIVNNDNMEPGGKGGGGNQRSSYNSWLAGNCCSGTGPARQLWDYVSCDPNCASGTHGEYPSYAVDNLGPAAEAEAWMVFNNNQIGELYYTIDGCMWANNGCSGPFGSQFASSVSMYGDGNMLAVGTNSTNCSGCGGAFVNVSQPIWLPTIRLKLMRDGVQDYEYLYYLNSLGGTHATVAANAVSEWINNGYCFNADAVAGATVSDHSGFCPASGSTTFTGDITDAKIAIGTDMHQLTFRPGGGTVLPQINLGISVTKNRAEHSVTSHGLEK